jgi:hypothetical protein
MTPHPASPRGEAGWGVIFIPKAEVGVNLR